MNTRILALAIGLLPMLALAQADGGGGSVVSNEVEALIARAVNQTVPMKKREAAAAAAMARLEGLLPDEAAARRLLDVAMMTADFVNVDEPCAGSIKYKCPGEKTCGGCLYDLGAREWFSRRVGLWGKPESWSFASVVSNSQGVMLVSGEARPRNAGCGSWMNACRRIPPESPVAKALAIVGETPEPGRESLASFPVVRASCEEARDSPGFRTATVGSGGRTVEHEACVPFQILKQPLLYESGSVTVLNAYGTREFAIGAMSKAKAGNPVPLCLRQGTGDCPGLRWMVSSDKPLVLEGDPLRSYEYRDEKLTLPPECRFPAGPKLTANAPVYVQDVRAILHFGPTFNGALVSIAPIGTACTALGPAKGDWVELQCGKDRGFALAWQVGTQPPSAEAFRQKAADKKLPPAQQLSYALRALALAPGDDAALQAFVESYYAIRWREYDKAQGGEDERTLDCGKVRQAPGAEPLTSAQACLTAAFRAAPFEWDVFRVDGKRFIRTVKRAKWLEEDYGTFSGDARSVKVRVVRRKWFGEAGVLETVLASRAERPAPGQTFDTSGPLLDPGSFSRIVKLPRHWMSVVGSDDTLKVRDSMCELRQHELNWDLNGIASMDYAAGQSTDTYSIIRYGLDDKMELCRWNGCQERHQPTFRWPYDYDRGWKVAEVEGFFAGEREYWAPADLARTLPRENEEHCEGNRYMGPSPYDNGVPQPTSSDGEKIPTIDDVRP